MRSTVSVAFSVLVDHQQPVALVTATWARRSTRALVFVFGSCLWFHLKCNPFRTKYFSQSAMRNYRNCSCPGNEEMKGISYDKWGKCYNKFVLGCDVLWMLKQI